MPVVLHEYESGLKKLQHFLRRFPRENALATAVGMYAAAQDIMALARSYAPIGPNDDPRAGHPGMLRRGAYADPPTVTARGVNLDMGFTGAPYLYMVKQHENVRYEHPQGGKAFYFRDAVDESRARTTATIARYVNQYLRTKRIPQVPSQKVPTKAQVPK